MASFSWVEALGYAAAAAVLATFCMQTMRPLRLVALASNVLFGLYGLLEGLNPVLLLHAILFPVNLYRLLQIRTLVKGVYSAPSIDVAIGKLMPLMTRRSVPAGHTLFEKGDKADRLYYVAAGTLRIEGLNLVCGAGDIIGEIGLFAPDQSRMATVVCETDCELYELSEGRMKELYFHDPAFSYAIIRLVTGRLLENYRLAAGRA